MGLMDEITEAQNRAPKGARTCPVCVLVDPDRTTLKPKSEARDLAVALADSNVFANTLQAVLKQRGHVVNTAAIQRHRREHVEGWATR